MADTPVLILLHGALGARAQLDPLARALAPHFRVHALEFAGHGSMPARGRSFSMDAFAAEVIEAMDAEGVGAALFFGYSMGGYVALQLAHSHPGRVRGVATLGTKFRWDPATAGREAARLDPEVIRTKVPRFAEALAARHELAGGWERVVAGTAAMLRDLGDRPLLTDEVLARIEAPVHVIVGDRDATVTVEESRSAAESLAAGDLTVLPGTPHPLEQVDLALLVPVLDGFFLSDTVARR